MKSPRALISDWPSSSNSSPALVGNPRSVEPQCPYTTTPSSRPKRCEYQRWTSFFIGRPQANSGKREYASARGRPQPGEFTSWAGNWPSKGYNSLFRRSNSEGEQINHGHRTAYHKAHARAYVQHVKCFPDYSSSQDCN